MGKTATESAPAAAPAPVQKRGPPRWMMSPGAPPKPDAKEHNAELKQLSQKKGALIAELKRLRASMGAKEENNKERDEIRMRLKELVDKRKAEQEMRAKTLQEISEVKKKQQEHVKKLRSLMDDLGGFKSVEEFDEAIAYMRKKMETGGGGLAVEKRIMRQIAQLEDAKRYLQDLEPVYEAIKEAEHRKAMLQQQVKEIADRIGGINEEYKGQWESKVNDDKRRENEGASRKEIYKKCDDISSNISTITKEMNTLESNFQKRMENWKAWCDEARKKHMAKLEEMRKERERRFLERKNAAKLAAKRERALRRMNPYKEEIATANTLLLYLKDQKIMVQREVDERAKREAAANFDPAAFAPEGATVLNGGTSGQMMGEGKKQKQNTNKVKRDAAPRPKTIKYSEEMLEMFKLVGEEPPKYLEDITGTMESIRSKLKEYSSHIKTGELVLSSDDEDEEEGKDEEKEEEEVAEEEEANGEVKEGREEEAEVDTTLKEGEAGDGSA